MQKTNDGWKFDLLIINEFLNVKRVVGSLNRRFYRHFFLNVSQGKFNMVIQANLIMTETNYC